MIEYYTPETFPVSWLHDIDIQTRNRGNQSTRQLYYYKDILCAFDIETTKIPGQDQSVMYVWQWAFGPDRVVIGRTWNDFILFAGKIRKAIKQKERLLILVHNLSFEFSFLKGIYPFDPDEVFCMDRRKVAKCTMWDFLEFRCSYIHSNMGLDRYTKSMKVEHGKLHDFDYDKVRWWFTPLDQSELDYITNDVVGLVEAASYEMEKDGDNYYTFPLTSTGYVRRDVKEALKFVNYHSLRNQLPDFELYQLLREEFRGGNTHANRYYVDVTMTDIVGHSADRCSAYPEEICNCKYPVSPFVFVKEEDVNFEKLNDLMLIKEKAILARVKLYNVSLNNPYWGCPYLAKSKCRNIINAVYDNGRILSADYLETTVTDIDLGIISQEYNCSIEPITIAYARYGHLPTALVDVVLKYFRLKNELKGLQDEESQYFYMKAKNKLNSIYGLMAQDPVKITTEYVGGSEDPFKPETDPDDPMYWTILNNLLEKNNKRAFLAYQWGCWTTCWARYFLEQGIRLCHEQGTFLYCDTDSVKYLGDVDFTKYNNDRIKACLMSGAFASDINGNVHYMGVFEKEADYQAWRCLGAKKYAYVDMDGELHLTVAGVNKKLGAEELTEAGGIDKFREGFVFHKAGGMEAVYNDLISAEYYITEEGEKIIITSNVTLKPTTKTLGITEEYRDILTGCRTSELI